MAGRFEMPPIELMSAAPGDVPPGGNGPLRSHNGHPAHEPLDVDQHVTGAEDVQDDQADNGDTEQPDPRQRRQNPPAAGVNDQTLEYLRQKAQFADAVLQDPNIAQYIAARNGGKQPKFSTDPEPEPFDPSTIEWDKLTPAEQAANTSKMVVAEMQQHLRGVLEPLTQRLDQLEQVGTDFQKERTVKALEDLHASNPDLPQYADLMVKLSKQFPNASARQLLAMARDERKPKAQPPQQRRNTASERPTGLVRGQQQTIKAPPGPGGRAGMSQILEQFFRDNPDPFADQNGWQR